MESSQRVLTLEVPMNGIHSKRWHSWRDKVWARRFEILEALKAGQMEIPSKEDFLAMLPSFIWPEEITE